MENTSRAFPFLNFETAQPGESILERITKNVPFNPYFGKTYREKKLYDAQKEQAVKRRAKKRKKR